jgi:hypothetical protein
MGAVLNVAEQTAVGEFPSLCLVDFVETPVGIRG